MNWGGTIEVSNSHKQKSGVSSHKPQFDPISGVDPMAPKGQASISTQHSQLPLVLIVALRQVAPLDVSTTTGSRTAETNGCRPVNRNESNNNKGIV